MKRKIPICRAHGHINLYTATTFHNLLETSGLTVRNSRSMTRLSRTEAHKPEIRCAAARRQKELVDAVAGGGPDALTHLATACDCG